MAEPSTGKVIIKTAVITTAALLLACVVLAVFIFFCFPYVGYKFTVGLNMNKSALFFVEKYEDDGNIDGLVYCLELDETLLSKNNEHKYALNIISHTEKFFTYNDYEEFFERIDNYYIENSPRLSHVSLYSYYDYVVSCNFKARALVGEDHSMIFRGKVTKLDSIFPSDITTKEKAVIYSAVNTYIDQGEKSIIISDDNNVTDFYNKLKASIPEYIYHLEENDSLKTLYLLRNAVQLIYKVSALLDEANLKDPDWESFKELTLRDKALSKAYDELFFAYIQQ